MRQLPVLTTLLTLSGCFGLQENASTDTGVLMDTAAWAEGQAGTPTSVALAGKLYVIAAEDLTLVDPAGLNELFHTALSQNVLVYIARESETSLTLDVSLADTDGAQNPCEVVRTLPEADWQNPFFSAGPGEMDVSFGGDPAMLRHLTVAGTFDEYAFNWRDGTLVAQIDARELTAALAGVDACDLVADAGGACEACDDGAVQCITLRFDDVVATQSSAAYDDSPTCAD